MAKILNNFNLDIISTNIAETAMSELNISFVEIDGKIYAKQNDRINEISTDEFKKTVKFINYSMSDKPDYIYKLYFLFYILLNIQKNNGYYVSENLSTYNNHHKRNSCLNSPDKIYEICPQTLSINYLAEKLKIQEKKINDLIEMLAKF